MTNTGINVKIFRLGACLKCQGDLLYDEGDWLCLQCGVYYYTGLYNDSGNQGGPTLRIARIRPDADRTGRPGTKWLTA